MDKSVLVPEAIQLREHAATRDDAIRRCGGVLVEVGAVDPAYVEACSTTSRLGWPKRVHPRPLVAR